LNSKYRESIQADRYKKNGQKKPTKMDITAARFQEQRKQLAKKYTGNIVER
jgi:hypothetical protein